MKKLGLNHVDEIDATKVNAMVYEDIPRDKAWVPDLLRELLDVRDNGASLEGFSKDECGDLIALLAGLRNFFFVRDRKIWSPSLSDDARKKNPKNGLFF